jgi:hypothetical protein
MKTKTHAAIAAAEKLDELLEAVLAHDDERDGFDDLADLPTFGGRKPTDTAGIYSWDETRLLLGPGGAADPSQPYEIVDRAAPGWWTDRSEHSAPALRALHDLTQTTPCEGGEVVARIAVDGSSLRIELSWRDDEGREGRMPEAIYDALAEHSDTDELEEAIAEATGQRVTLDWRETHAIVRLRERPVTRL